MKKAVDEQRKGYLYFLGRKIKRRPITVCESIDTIREMKIIYGKIKMRVKYHDRKKCAVDFLLDYPPDHMTPYDYTRVMAQLVFKKGR